MHLFKNAMEQEPNEEGVRRTKYAVIRSSYPALKSTVIKTWKDWFKGMIKIVYDTPIRGEIRLPHPDGETKIEMDLVFIALDREEEVNKLQSLELTGAHINEAAEMLTHGIFQVLKTRIRRYPPKREGGPTLPFILLDYNSPDDEHWLYKLAEETRPDKNHSFYVQPPAVFWDGTQYIVNPEAENLDNLPDGIAYYEEMCQGNTWDYINVFIMNNYGQVRTGKPVYVDYDDQAHCAKKNLKVMEGIPLIIGMDLGLTPAAAFCQLNPIGQMVTIDELVTEDCSISRFCDDFLWPHIRNYYRSSDFTLIIDPSGNTRSENDKKSAADIIRKAGLPFRYAKTNNPLARREAVNYFLNKKDGFLLSPNCKVLRKGFISGYQFEKVLNARETRYKEQPKKNIYSHIHDAEQYAALEMSEGRLVKRRKVKVQTHNAPASKAGY
jgi:hypothetical protein